MNTPPPLPSVIPLRSARVTLLAWLVILSGALLTPISFISILMTISHHYGDWSGNPLEALCIFLGPPLTFVAGIGLLRRKRWARAYLLVLLAAVLGYNILGIIRGPTPASTFTSADGVPTTVMGSEARYSPVIMAGSVLVIVMLLSKKIRDEFSTSGEADAPSVSGSASEGPSGRPIGWRVGHRGRDLMYYEEKIGGAWERLDLDGEMLMGRAHHVIYFASAERWQSHPDWARHRRDEIIARIKTQFRQPDYEYQGDGAQAAPALPDDSAPSSSAPQAMPRHATSAQAGPHVNLSIKPARDFRSSFVLLLVAAALLCVAGWMAWLVGSGLDTGETRLPMKRTSLQRIVSRAQEPEMFFVSIGIYSVIGLGTFGLAAWGLKEAFQPRK